MVFYKGKRKGPDGRILCEYVSWSYDILVSITVPVSDCWQAALNGLPLRDVPAFVLISAYNQDGLVLELVQIRKWSVALNEHAHIQRHLKLLTQIPHSFCLAFSSAVGEQYEGYVLGLKEGKSFVSLRNWIMAP